MQQNKTASQRKTINPACWVPTAYFAMGLPFIAINLVSVFMFKDLGISDTQIAFWTSLIMMPWTLKFLWSPFLEMYRTKKFFVLITELLSGVLFGVVAFSLFFDYFFVNRETSSIVGSGKVSGTSQAPAKACPCVMTIKAFSPIASRQEA